MRKTLLWIGIAVTMIALVGAVVPSAQAGAKTVIKIGTVVAPDHPENVGARKIKELIEKKAGDRVDVQVFTDGQIGDQRTMVENMRNGVQEITWVTVGFFGSYEPILNVIESGYLFRDSQHSYKVFDGPMGERGPGPGRKARGEAARLLRSRHAAHHQQRAADQDPGGSQGVEDPDAPGQVPSEHAEVHGGQPRGDVLRRTVHRHAAEGGGRPGEPLLEHLQGQVLRGEQVHVADRPLALDPHGDVQRQAVGPAAGRSPEDRARVRDRVAGGAAQGGPGRRRRTC